MLDGLVTRELLPVHEAGGLIRRSVNWDSRQQLPCPSSTDYCMHGFANELDWLVSVATVGRVVD